MSSGPWRIEILPDGRTRLREGRKFDEIEIKLKWPPRFSNYHNLELYDTHLTTIKKKYNSSKFAGFLVSKT